MFFGMHIPALPWGGKLAMIGRPLKRSLGFRQVLVEL
jgi:hypothetical protein